MADDNAPYVVLMGSVKSGKSSLIASMRKCAEEGTHGLAETIRVRIGEDDAAFDPRQQGRALDGISPSAAQFIRQRRLTELETDAFNGKDYQLDATVEDAIYVYPLRMSFNYRTRSAPVARFKAPASIRLIDAAGGLILPTDGQRRDAALQPDEMLSDRKRAYRDLVQRAQGVIFCIDVTSDDAADWQTSFSEMEEVLAAFPNDELRRRIAIAFTKTEYLFSLDGRLAIFNALRRDVVRPRISRALNVTAAEILRRWSELETRHRNRFDVRCFPTSTYGYLRHNGCANYSHATDGWLIGDSSLYEDIGVLGKQPSAAGDEIGGRYSKLWRPTLTIDPLIYAAFGDVPEVASRFMFTINEFVELPPVEDDAEDDAAPKRRTKSRWSLRGRR